MQRIRYGFVVLVAMFTSVGVFGGTAATLASAHACTDRATDNDVEYPGDDDTWCTPDPNALASPAPGQTVGAPTPSPVGSTPAPAAPATASPTAAPNAAPTPSSAPSPAPMPVTGAFPVAYFAPDFKGPATRQFNQQFITTIGNYVTVTYPAGSSAPSSGVPGGAQAQLTMTSGPVDNATLSYWVRFPVGFQFVKGGKLPGLCGGACWTGANNGPGGWAGRFMWRAGGEGEVLINDANTTGYGTDLGRGSNLWHFQADGLWHTISEHVRMNTPGVADGIIDVTYDGVQVAHFTGIMFRADASTHADSLMFSTFYGGHDSSWAPSADMHIDFASFHNTL